MNVNITDILSSVPREASVYDDLYAHLNCKPSATTSQLTTEYRLLARTLHPDKSPEDPEKAAEQYELITLAWSILGDPEEREIYDRWKSSGIRVPYKEWRTHVSTAESLHWKCKKVPMGLEHPDHPPTPYAAARTAHPSAPSQEGSRGHDGSTDDIYARFRSYQI